MKRIKVKVREKLPETNSSSSHSVVICSDGNYLNASDPEWNLLVDDSGTIRIPGNIQFGWEYEKYNDPLTKIQYVCGILCRDRNYSKKLKRLSEIIKSFTGAKKVIYQWEEDYQKEIESGVDPEDTYKQVPEIDHNSSDIFPDIIENINTIKDFIFSPKSWLYTGNDNSGAPSGFFDIPGVVTEKEPEAIFSIDLGDGIGRVDFEIPIFPNDVHDAFVEAGGYDILNSVIIKKDEISGKLSSVDYSKLVGITTIIDDKSMFIFNNILTARYIKSGQRCVIFTNSKLMDEGTRLCNKYNGEELIKKLVELVDSNPDIAFKFPISIVTNEFGDIYNEIS